jgi:hypothetical protein
MVRSFVVVYGNPNISPESHSALLVSQAFGVIDVLKREKSAGRNHCSRKKNALKKNDMLPSWRRDVQSAGNINSQYLLSPIVYFLVYFV